METRKLLLADPSVSLCAALTEALGGAYEVRSCQDGVQARVLLSSFQPDILVTDLALPGVDGISVLKAAAGSAKRPVMLVTSRFMSAYIETVINELEVDYLVMKPCDIHALVERIQDLNQCDRIEMPRLLPRVAVSNMLQALEIPVNRKGYSYLEAAIDLYEKNLCQSVTKVLYPEIGKQNGVSGVSVERAIRGAIDTAWENRDERVWRLYFASSRNGIIPRPTNTVFIATLAELLGQQKRQANI